MASRVRWRAFAERRLRNVRLRARRIRAASPASRFPWRRATLCSTLRIVQESPGLPGKISFSAIRTTLGCSQLCVNNNNKTYKKLRGRSKDLRGKLRKNDSARVQKMDSARDSSGPLTNPRHNYAYVAYSTVGGRRDVRDVVTPRSSRSARPV